MSTVFGDLSPDFTAGSQETWIIMKRLEVHRSFYTHLLTLHNWLLCLYSNNDQPSRLFLPFSACYICLLVDSHSIISFDQSINNSQKMKEPDLIDFVVFKTCCGFEMSVPLLAVVVLTIEIGPLLLYTMSRTLIRTISIEHPNLWYVKQVSCRK